MTEETKEIRRSPHLDPCGWCEEADRAKVFKVTAILMLRNYDDRFLDEEGVETEMSRMFNDETSVKIIDCEERAAYWHDCHPLNYSKITNEEILDEWNKMKPWKD